MKISGNFSRKEFACKCGCGFSTADVELIELLELIRYKFKEPIIINSACRCEIHNTAIGGSYGSKHKQGIAADIVVKNVDPAEVYKFVNSHAPTKYGIGLYNGFTHVDVRIKKARWKG